MTPMRRSFSLIITVLLALACGGNTDVQDNNPAPKLVSISPADGTADIPRGPLSITLTYDQNITFTSSSVDRIEITGGSVRNCKAEGKSLILTAVFSGEGSAVTITVPKGVVKNRMGTEADAVTFRYTLEKAYEPDSDKNPLTDFPAAVKLFRYFDSQYGKKIISSVMANVNWNNECAEKVFALTGKYPAMNCYDFIHIHYSPAGWIDYTNLEPVLQWADAGGLVQLMWHFNVPYDEAAGSKTDDWTCSPDKTTFKGSNALKEGTWENRLFYKQMDKVAATILKLQEAGIAATWRPFHEAAGNSTAKTWNGTAWFWWGYEGADVFKQLWITMYDYFKEKGIKNLIWVWTTQNYNNSPSSYYQDTDWYPGDKYVDMIARDLYGCSTAQTLEDFKQIQETYPGKMVALGECGYGGDPVHDAADIDALWKAGALWSHFMVWYKGDYGSTGTMASDEWWKSAMSADCVITRDELPVL